MEKNNRLVHDVGTIYIFFSMNIARLRSRGIGQSLIGLFSVGLILIIISLVISSVILNKIDTTRGELTHSSIPALVGINKMSIYAHDIIQSSLKMSQAKNIYELNARRESAFDSILKLKNELANQNIMGVEVANIDNILDAFENNVNSEYALLKNIIENNVEYITELKLMSDALEAMTDFTLIAKINVKAALAEQLTQLNKNDSYENITRDSITNVDVVSELIVRISELRKDIRAINSTSSKDDILAIQQEFDHSLRIITRTVIKSKKLALKNNLGPHIIALIKYGQDTPDIFDARLNLIQASSQVNEMHAKNISLTKELNDAVNLLSDSVVKHTEYSSSKLESTVQVSKYIFYIIAVISIITFMLLIWKFIYKNIVLRLFALTAATRKLSGNNLNFNIDTTGDDEFSQIATSLDALKSLTKVRKKLHEDLKVQSALLKRSNEDLNLFAYVASHDLQEPLRVISSYSQLLSKRYADKLDEDADKFIDYIVSGCSRMESLIEGLLRLSRIDSQNINSQSIWVEDVLKEVKKDLSIKINTKFALVTWSEMPTIYADPVQVKTVFQNIISNALKYNQSTPPKIHIKAEKHNEFWRFYIEDNGIGIEEENYDKIFVIFKRLHSRNKYTGTGIGLSICKKIVERCGGEISVQSNLNHGTTFIFTLPVDDRYHLHSANEIAA